MLISGEMHHMGFPQGLCLILVSDDAHFVFAVKLFLDLALQQHTL